MFVIGQCAFGIECNSLKDPNAEFRRLVIEKSRNGRLITLLLQTFRNFSRFLRIKITLDEVEKFFLRIVNETGNYREEKSVSFNDFMDLLIKIKNGKNLNELSINELAA